MKAMVAKLQLFRRKPSITRFAVRTITTDTSSAALTEDELTQINTVIPRLCTSNHLKDAINLISAALSTANPPLDSLPISFLVSRLAHEPDLTHPMHFLNAIKYSSETLTPHLIQIVKMFVSSFFEKSEPKKALKIFQWLSRPDFPVTKDLELYAVFVDGFCRNGMVLDAIRVVRVMASEDMVIGSEVRNYVYRGLLREARVREAMEVNAALDSCNGDDLHSKKVMDLLDRMIENWTD